MNFLNNKLNIFNNIAQDARKRKALTFRKRLGIYNYKIKPTRYFKNPHAVPFQLKEKLRKKNSSLNIRKLYHIRQHSNKPYGYFTKKHGTFHFDISKVPNYDIPDVNDFYMKPYFENYSVPAPSYNPEDGKTKFDLNSMDRIRTQLLLSDNKDVRRIGLELFETEFGKSVVKEFIESQDRNYFFDETSMKHSMNRNILRAKISDKDFRENLDYEDIPVFEKYPSIALRVVEKETKAMEINEFYVKPWYFSRYPNKNKLYIEEEKEEREEREEVEEELLEEEEEIKISKKKKKQIKFLNSSKDKEIQDGINLGKLH